MQRLLEAERFRPVVPSLQLHLQFRAYHHPKTHMKNRLEESARSLAGRQREGDLDVSTIAQLRAFDGPLHAARKAMGRPRLAIAARSEPGEDDGHAPANR